VVVVEVKVGVVSVDVVDDGFKIRVAGNREALSECPPPVGKPRNSANSAPDTNPVGVFFFIVDSSARESSD
jgi:hypothetical protein